MFKGFDQNFQENKTCEHYVFCTKYINSAQYYCKHWSPWSALYDVFCLTLPNIVTSAHKSLSYHFHIASNDNLTLGKRVTDFQRFRSLISRMLPNNSFTCIYFQIYFHITSSVQSKLLTCCHGFRNHNWVLSSKQLYIQQNKCLLHHSKSERHSFHNFHIEEYIKINMIIVARRKGNKLFCMHLLQCQKGLFAGGSWFPLVMIIFSQSVCATCSVWVNQSKVIAMISLTHHSITSPGLL